MSSLIVEGHALREYRRDYLRYLSRSYGSAEETGEHLLYIQETTVDTCVEGECVDLRTGYESLCRQILNYRERLERRRQD